MALPALIHCESPLSHCQDWRLLTLRNEPHPSLEDEDDMVENGEDSIKGISGRATGSERSQLAWNVFVEVGESRVLESGCNGTSDSLCGQWSAHSHHHTQSLGYVGGKSSREANLWT
jgi:hypothetical protein